jgi:Tol biopolymer transport system component/DNA-binding winged helix-turn-helix (wHTH) protein
MMGPGNTRYRFDDFELDVSNRRLIAAGENCPLEPKSFRLLQFLVENRSRTVPKDEIVAAVWPGTFVSDNSITRAVTQVRKALHDDAKEPKYIETVPTVGYRFIGVCIEEENPTVPPDASEEGKRSRTPLAAAAFLTLAIAAGAWWFIAGRGSSTAPYPLHVIRVSKLTSYPGNEREPAISPDGSYVAFSWSGPAGDNYDIYVVQQAGGQQPLRLTRDPAPDSFPAWSPDGSQIGFVRRHGSMAEIITVPPLGGPERTLYQFYSIGTDLDFSQHPLLTWSRDGKSIIYSGQSAAGEKYRLFLLSVDTGEVRPISSPDMDLAGDSSPALSADGESLAFVRYLAPRNGRLLIQPLSPGTAPRGNLIDVMTSGLAPRSPAWLEDGKQLLFADATQIFERDRTKGAVQIYAADGFLGGLSLGPKRPDNTWHAVVATEKEDPDIWEIPLNAAGTQSTGPPKLLIRSTEDDSHPEYSPDGRRMAFSSNRSGSDELWISDADGANPRQLTHLGAHVTSYPKWSPDGTKIVFHARVPDIAEVYVIDVNAGVPRQITHEDPGLAVATWSRDGRFIYASTLVGKGVSYRIPANGGAMVRLWEGDDVLESADGRYIFYTKTNAPGIFRRSLAGDPAKNPEEVIVPDYWRVGQLGGYVPVAGGIYYVSGDAQGKPGPFRYFNYASRKSMDVAPAVPGLGRGFSVSPDRRTMAFAASSEVGGDLLSLELR